MQNEWICALLGGVLIGASASLMLLLNGRVAGISSIVYGLINPIQTDISWRISFILGLLSGGAILHIIQPSLIATTLTFSSNWSVLLAGVCVGFGSALGSGCTSGHGVCGISRLSFRSIFATGLFICAGIATLFILKKLGFFV
jgi:uncharacterized protein